MQPFWICPRRWWFWISSFDRKRMRECIISNYHYILSWWWIDKIICPANSMRFSNRAMSQFAEILSDQKMTAKNMIWMGLRLLRNRINSFAVYLYRNMASALISLSLTRIQFESINWIKPTIFTMRLGFGKIYRKLPRIKNATIKRINNSLQACPLSAHRREKSSEKPVGNDRTYKLWKIVCNK